MRLTTLTATLSLALLSTIALAQSVSYDFDRTANFAALRTYAWTQGTSLPDAINHRRIIAAVDAQLAAKGMRPASTAGDPDALVAYHASFERNLHISAFGTGWGPYSRGGSARAQEITVGTMAIEIVDAKTRALVWRGLASADIDVDAKPEKREKNIHRAAEKLFRNYPPKG
jgi:hypothetical protein